MVGAYHPPGTPGKVYAARFAPEDPKAGFGKIQTALLTAQTVHQGPAHIEIRTLSTSARLPACAAGPGLAQVARWEHQFHGPRTGRTYRTAGEVELGLTSLTRPATSALPLWQLRRTPWGIETGWQYRRHVTRQEAATPRTTGIIGIGRASLIHLVLALIR